VKATENLLLTEAKGVDTTARSSANGSSRRVLRVWVVDDNAALRELFAQLLTKQPGIRCKRQFPSAEAVLATLAEERPPDMILLDINLGSQSGLSAIRHQETRPVGQGADVDHVQQQPLRGGSLPVGCKRLPAQKLWV